jgi:hypothetical protein
MVETKHQDNEFAIELRKLRASQRKRLLRGVLAIVVLFLLLFAYGGAMTITIRSTLIAYVEAFQKHDPKLAQYGTPPKLYYPKEATLVTRRQRFFDCLQRPDAWTIEHPAFFTLNGTCAEIKLSCGKTYLYGAAQLERRHLFSWFIKEIECNHCK